MKRILLVAMVVLLGGCASSGTRDGMVYRDGSWYAPAGEGRGDYYTGEQLRHRPHPAYDWPWGWSTGFVPYGGFCPVQYRYCTSFWAGGPFYSGPGYYYPYWYAWHPRGGHRHRALDEQPWDRGPIAEAGSRPREPARERTRPERPRSRGVSESPRREGRGESRPRRRVSASDTHPN